MHQAAPRNSDRTEMLKVRPAVFRIFLIDASMFGLFACIYSLLCDDLGLFLKKTQHNKNTHVARMAMIIWQYWIVPEQPRSVKAKINAGKMKPKFRPRRLK